MRSSVGFVVGALALGLICCPAAWGQSTAPTQDQIREAQAERDAMAALEAQRRERERAKRELSRPLPPLRNYFPTPPRKITEEHKRLLYPSDEDKNRFEAFLRMPRTGLIRMLPQSICRDDRRVVKVGGSCWDAIPPVPGGGSFYSFSRNKYQAGLMAELWLSNNLFYAGFAGSVMGLITTLGDVPLEDITMQSSGVNYLSNFTAPGAVAEAERQFQRIRASFRAGEYTYGATAPVREGTTYAMRSITYTDDDSPGTKALKPIDVLVVFRVVSRAPDGSVTILWKELRRQKSVKLAA